MEMFESCTARRSDRDGFYIFQKLALLLESDESEHTALRNRGTELESGMCIFLKEKIFCALYFQHFLEVQQTLH